MMNRIRQPSGQRHTDDAPPPDGLGTDPDRIIRNASLIAVFSSNPPVEVATFGFVGEFLLALWLVIRGRRLTSSELHEKGEE